MGQQSKIEWTDHTFNPWWGCMKVSAGCKNCYAETLDHRYHAGHEHWGPGSTRKPMSDKYWLQPIKWNAAAQKSGVKAKVFCASMADVFEGHPDTLPHLTRLFKVIEATPWLIWQLLTKRPENIKTLIKTGTSWYENGFPANVWIGTSVEDQAAADQRIRHLMNIPAAIRFLSCEPLIGPVDLSNWFGLYEYDDDKYALKVGSRWESSPDWVIVGGESGPDARPMNPQWARMLRDQCSAAQVPFFFKQWGEWVTEMHDAAKNTDTVSDAFVVHQVLENGNADYLGLYMHKVGKHAAGSLLDQEEHKYFPPTLQ